MISKYYEEISTTGTNETDTMDSMKLNLTNLTSDEILQINSVLLRNQQLSKTELKRTKWLKFSSFGSSRELQKLHGFEFEIDFLDSKLG